MKNIPGEAAINPQAQASLASDITSPRGKIELMGKLIAAHNIKPALDNLLGSIAKKVGGEFSSRIKNPETIVQKIAQKRLAGRDYALSDVNDLYGGRITVPDNKVNTAIEQVKNVEKSGEFDIDKAEQIKKDTYSAFHIDGTYKGVPVEVQIHTPQSELESVANHGLRALYGETPPSQVQSLRDKQAALAGNISDARASQKTQAIKTVSGGNPIDPRIIASLLASK